MKSLLTSLLDLLQLQENQKAEILIKGKEIARLREKAKVEFANMTDDEFDELTLAFGESFQKIMRG